MKKTLSKIKVYLATVWIAIISFSSKVFGQKFNDSMGHIQTFYGVRMPEKYIPPEPLTSTTSIAIKIAQILLVTIIFIVGIISFIKIRKIDDKNLKKKKIRNTIIIITILVLLLIASFIIPRLLLTK